MSLSLRCFAIAVTSYDFLLAINFSLREKSLFVRIFNSSLELILQIILNLLLLVEMISRSN